MEDYWLIIGMLVILARVFCISSVLLLYCFCITSVGKTAGKMLVSAGEERG